MNIYLARHGQTTGDIENRYGGDYDDHLTPLGQKQSHELGEKLVKLNPKIIYVSPKIRAQETAQIIKDTIGSDIPLVTDDGFRERNRYGALSGLTKQEAISKFPDEVEKLKDEHTTLDGGEDYESFGKRIGAALAKVDTGEYSDVVVVTHGGPIRYIFREILKKGEIEIGDCSYAKLSITNDTYAVLELNGIELLHETEVVRKA